MGQRANLRGFYGNPEGREVQEFDKVPEGELVGPGDCLPVEKSGGMSLRQLNVCAYVNLESNVCP